MQTENAGSSGVYDEHRYDKLCDMSPVQAVTPVLKLHEVRFDYNCVTNVLKDSALIRFHQIVETIKSIRLSLQLLGIWSVGWTHDFVFLYYFQ